MALRKLPELGTLLIDTLPDWQYPAGPIIYVGLSADGVACFLYPNGAVLDCDLSEDFIKRIPRGKRAS